MRSPLLVSHQIFKSDSDFQNLLAYGFLPHTPSRSGPPRFLIVNYKQTPQVTRKLPSKPAAPPPPPHQNVLFCVSRCPKCLKCVHSLFGLVGFKNTTGMLSPFQDPHFKAQTLGSMQGRIQKGWSRGGGGGHSRNKGWSWGGGTAEISTYATKGLTGHRTHF